MATMTKRKMKGVSLSGKTRLTYREAFALFEAALEGQADWDERADDPNAVPEKQYEALRRALSKLTAGLQKSGGWDGGSLFDPFEDASA